MMRLMTELENEIQKFEQLSRRLKMEKSNKTELIFVEEPNSDYGKKMAGSERRVMIRKVSR